jgi:hypothetical protein
MLVSFLSLSNSASTSPMRVCCEAVPTTADKFAQAFQGPRRAICDNSNC